MGVEEVLKRKTGVIVGEDVYNLCMPACLHTSNDLGAGTELT